MDNSCWALFWAINFIFLVPFLYGVCLGPRKDGALSLHNFADSRRSSGEPLIVKTEKKILPRFFS